MVKRRQNFNENIEIRKRLECVKTDKRISITKIKDLFWPTLCNNTLDYIAPVYENTSESETVFWLLIDLTLIGPTNIESVQRICTADMFYVHDCS